MNKILPLFIREVHFLFIPFKSLALRTHLCQEHQRKRFYSRELTRRVTRKPICAGQQGSQETSKESETQGMLSLVISPSQLGILL